MLRHASGVVARIAAFSLIPLVGCGDNLTGPNGYPFDDPSDFDRSRCTGAARIGDLDLTGELHADIDFGDDFANSGLIQIERAGGGGLTGRLFGRPADRIEQTDTELFVRVENRMQADLAVRALSLCGVQDDGSLVGVYASCSNGQCALADVVAHRMEPLDEPESQNMTLYSEFSGASWPETELTLNLRHDGNVVYLARMGDGLRIVDVSDPAAPADLGHARVMFPDDEYYNDVKIVHGPGGRTYAIAGSNVRGAVVIDVTDPSAPVETTTFPRVMPGGPTSFNVHSIFVVGALAYVAELDSGGISVHDITDPTAPVERGAFVDDAVGTLGGFVHDLFVDDAGRAYLDYWNLGLVVVDGADTAAPHAIGRFDSYPRRTSHSNWVTVAGGRRVSIHGDESFGAHVRIIDVDEDSSEFMTEIGSFETRPWVSVHNIMAVGEIALVTYYQDGLRVLDLADPTRPVEIAHFDSWRGPGASSPGFFEGAIGVDHDPVRGLIYLADTHRGLFVLGLDR